MQPENCFQLGTLVRKSGTDGRVILQLDTDNPKAYQKTESVFVEIHGTLVPFFIEQFRLQPSNNAQVKFKDINDEEQSKTLIGCPVYLPLSALPPLSGNRFYYHEVIGWEIQDLNSGQSAGIIQDVVENGPNDLFICMNGNHEILIPVADDFIEEVNREQRVIRMRLPEGLLEVNLKPE